MCKDHLDFLVLHAKIIITKTCFFYWILFGLGLIGKYCDMYIVHLNDWETTWEPQLWTTAVMNHHKFVNCREGWARFNSKQKYIVLTY